MLKFSKYLKYSLDLEVEAIQAAEEGKDISPLKGRIQEILQMDDADPHKDLMAAEIYDEIAGLPAAGNYPYWEPSDLEGIKAARPMPVPSIDKRELSDTQLFDKAYGAWLGRCAGCLLGKPLEGWMRDRINGLLKDTDNYPFHYYVSSDIPQEIRERYKIENAGKGSSWINNVNCMPEDDDTNYTVIGLRLLEKYGPDFTPEDAAECWLGNLPILHTFTAERAAYRNLVNLIPPPESAAFRNPYREWIGAQIRADFFGYVTPGNPELGAEFAWRDASISHIKNGIYGEMFVAAMLSSAYFTSDVEEIIHAGLSQIPERSRLTEKVREVLEWRKKGMSWEQAIDRIHTLYDETSKHDWCHTISNALIVCVGLLYGELDLEKSIGIAVLGAMDTDCNGATVGSIVGMVLGAGALPEKWIQPLHDQLKSGVDGFGLVKISDMAKRTIQVLKTVKQQQD